MDCLQEAAAKQLAPANQLLASGWRLDGDTLHSPSSTASAMRQRPLDSALRSRGPTPSPAAGAAGSAGDAGGVEPTDLSPRFEVAAAVDSGGGGGETLQELLDEWETSLAVQVAEAVAALAAEQSAWQALRRSSKRLLATSLSVLTAMDLV